MSFLECGGGMIGGGWSALPSSMVEKNYFHPKLFPPTFYCTILKRQIYGGGDHSAVAEGSASAWQ